MWHFVISFYDYTQKHHLRADDIYLKFNAIGNMQRNWMACE